MTDPFDRDKIVTLLLDLSDELEQRGARADLFVVGGAAMTLAYDLHRTTRDLDAVFVPTNVVRHAAKTVGEKHGLDPDWLNDAVKGFLPGDDSNAVTYFESGSLRVDVASPQYMLAMKLLAARPVPTSTTSRPCIASADTRRSTRGYA